MVRNHDIIEIACELRHETEKAYLIFNGDKAVWIPKSICEWDETDNTMQLPEWWAQQKELI